MTLSKKELDDLEEIVKYGTPESIHNSIKNREIEQEDINKLFVRSLVSGRYDMFNYFLQDSTLKADINALRCESILGRGNKPCIENYLTPNKDFNIGDPIFKECNDPFPTTYNRQDGAHQIIDTIVQKYPEMLKEINIPVIAAHFRDKKTLEDVLKTPDKYCDINTSMCTRATNVLKISVDSEDTQLFENLLDHPQIKPGDYSLGLNNPIMSAKSGNYNAAIQHTTALLSMLHERKYTIHHIDVKELLGLSFLEAAKDAETPIVKDFVNMLSKIIKHDPKLKEVAEQQIKKLRDAGLLELDSEKQDIIINIQNDVPAASNVSKDVITNIQNDVHKTSKLSKTKTALHKIKSTISKLFHATTKLPDAAKRKFSKKKATKKEYNKLENTR